LHLPPHPNLPHHPPHHRRQQCPRLHHPLPLPLRPAAPAPAGIRLRRRAALLRHQPRLRVDAQPLPADHRRHAVAALRHLALPGRLPRALLAAPRPQDPRAAVAVRHGADDPGHGEPFRVRRAGRRGGAAAGVAGQSGFQRPRAGRGLGVLGLQDREAGAVCVGQGEGVWKAQESGREWRGESGAVEGCGACCL
ncbi:hypothetical protein SLS57_012245, partial [Botryosphaeria dothidea]